MEISENKKKVYFNDSITHVVRKIIVVRYFNTKKLKNKLELLMKES